MCDYAKWRSYVVRCTLIHAMWWACTHDGDVVVRLGTISMET